MMYNEGRPPRRRMYINGYYSEWFGIKSGVAQGCPLSPLLFLVVAEALNTSFEMEPGLEGIQIGKRYYKLSQFADDTSLLLRRLCEIENADRALKKKKRIHRIHVYSSPRARPHTRLAGSTTPRLA
jgi:hypothetical protein